MKATIVAKGVKLPQLVRDYVTRRLQFALNHVRQSISGVIVRISDQNGPKGGIDKQCRIQINVTGMRSIVVSSQAVRIGEAVDLAADRAAMALGRTCSRNKRIVHTRYPAVETEA